MQTQHEEYVPVLIPILFAGAWGFLMGLAVMWILS